jgi:hypothetical protein
MLFRLLKFLMLMAMVVWIAAAISAMTTMFMGKVKGKMVQRTEKCCEEKSDAPSETDEEKPDIP